MPSYCHKCGELYSSASVAPLSERIPLVMEQLTDFQQNLLLSLLHSNQTMMQLQTQFELDTYRTMRTRIKQLGDVVWALFHVEPKQAPFRLVSIKDWHSQRAQIEALLIGINAYLAHCRETEHHKQTVLQLLTTIQPNSSI